MASEKIHPVIIAPKEIPTKKVKRIFTVDPLLALKFVLYLLDLAF